MLKLPPPKQQNLPDPGTDSPFARLSLAAAPLFLESVIEGWRLEIETRVFLLVVVFIPHFPCSSSRGQKVRREMLERGRT